MQSHSVTTPFGRRSMSLALVKGQLDAAEIPQGKSVDKWKVFRDASEARETLGITDRALAVLNALLSFHPDTVLEEGSGLVVFPSNNQLSIRANGITGTTLRRHLAALVDAGLVIRKDSPNGKRYARKNDEGGIESAFGFSLAPLLARSEELAHMAQAVAAQRKALRVLRERLSVCRRDVRKLLSMAMEEGIPGDWQMIEGLFIALLARIPRTPTTASLHPIAEEMEMLRDEILNLLENRVKSQKTDANDSHNGRHIQNSNTNYSNESETGFERAPETKSMDHLTVSDGRLNTADIASIQPAAREPLTSPPIKAFPLPLVLKACPGIADYGPGGAIGSWRDLMAAAVVVRSTLGVSPSAYEDACAVMGAENAAVAMACILERAGQINSAGGYLRNLTRKAERGEFSLGPMLMALLRLAEPARKSAKAQGV